jgi:hypothetical protein
VVKRQSLLFKLFLVVVVLFMSFFCQILNLNPNYFNFANADQINYKSFSYLEDEDDGDSSDSDFTTTVYTDKIDLDDKNDDSLAEQVDLSWLSENVTLQQTTEIQAVSERSNLPITINNASQYFVKLVLQARTESQKIDIDDNKLKQTIIVEPYSEKKVIVPLVMRANGEGLIHVNLATEDGDQLDQRTISININVTIGKTLMYLFYIFIILMFVLGIYRTVKKIKNRSNILIHSSEEESNPAAQNKAEQNNKLDSE